MECLFCLCSTDLPILSCKGYGCDRVSCVECVKIMIDVCFNTINSMPMCDCGHEYLSSQLSILPIESMDKYIIMCKRSIETPRGATINEKIADREARIAMIEEVKSQTRKEIKEALPVAISKLMIISGLESKLIEFKKQQQTTKTPPRRCVSFTCKGRLIENDNILKCLSCSLLVCSSCDAVRSKSDHECKKEDVESVELIKSIAKCPSCGVPATRGDGCIFITCPYCNTNFDSKTGQKTHYGGHNNGEIKRKVEHDSITEAVPDSDTTGRILLSKIKNAKPTKSVSKRSDRVYESSYKRKVYSSTINRIYELRDSGRLNNEELANILAYLKQI